MKTQLLAPQQARAALELLPPHLCDWLDAEQSPPASGRVDRRVLNPGNLDAVPSEFRPAQHRVWLLPAYWVPRGALWEWHAPLGRLPLPVAAGTRRLMLFHPMADPPRALMRGARPGPLLWASATASLRTLLVWSPEPGIAPFFAKVSIPAVVAAEHRGLDASDVMACVGKTRLLPLLQRHHPRLRVLREPYGAVGRDGAPLGWLLREIPPDVLRGTTQLRPWFAAGRASLVEPLVQVLTRAAVQAGVACEAHGQNLLVELDAQARPTGRFCMRDLEGVSVDLAHVEALGVRERRAVRSLPVRTNLHADYEQLEHPRALERSLHTFFLGGPMHALGLGPRVLRRAVARAVRAVEGGTTLPVDGAAYARWVETVRCRRRKAPAVPRSWRAWLHREQQVNDRVRHPTRFARVDLDVLPQQFHPETAPVFPLPVMLVPQAEVEAHIPDRWRSTFLVRRGKQTLVRFPVHPAAMEVFALDLEEHGVDRDTFVASPTSSPRSLLVWRRDGRGAPFGLKLSLDVELLGLSRLIRRSKLLRVVAVTTALDALPARELQEAGVAYFREPLTLRLRHQPHGTLLREYPDVTRHLVPGFSLFVANGSRLMRGSAEQRWAHVVERVFEPLVRAGAYLFFAQGLLPVLHQQNVLFETGARGLPQGRIWLRDLDAFRVDDDVRRRRGLTLEPWERSGGTRVDLKMDEARTYYDDAYGLQVRTEWVWLAQRLLGQQHTRALYREMDARFLFHAAAHLGLAVVLEELRYVLRHHVRAVAALAGVADAAALREVWRALPLGVVVDAGAPTRSVFSVNAMVHAWRRRHPING